MNKHVAYAVGAYTIWGLFPVYWRLLSNVPALQLISHRVVWSWLILAVAVIATRRWRDFRRGAMTARALLVYSGTATLISINWLVYVWAVNSGYIIETSLGYFINPLISVLLGVVLLRERLRPWQWVPIGLAAIGVLQLTFNYGAPPWIALALAFSFAGYGLLKKTAPLGSLHGLTLETGLLLLPALGFLVYSELNGAGAFLHAPAANPWSDTLIVCSGLLTIAPLLLFASAAPHIPLTLMGILQYIAPTLQFLLGVLLYNEPFDQHRLMGFAFVWSALLILSVGGILSRRRPPPPGGARPERTIASRPTNLRRD
jgi:chloramphenicol-sensitive protein RarD